MHGNVQALCASFTLDKRKHTLAKPGVHDR